MRPNDRFLTRDLRTAEYTAARRTWQDTVEALGLLVAPGEHLREVAPRWAFGFEHVTLTRGGEDRPVEAMADIRREGDAYQVVLSTPEAPRAAILGLSAAPGAILEAMRGLQTPLSCPQGPVGRAQADAPDGKTHAAHKRRDP